ncbi:putative membrane-bound metal-dependent hydrolase (plasmid) [Desulfocapsa sulfexigens DSM 10523]|uniref:Putative membrane-bound metal-dependent hydrolase n=1 Tax=Desulfocapsa sulfexigens (strain DSM 10523 / SB164P1) TaxID=1167006 RepID=M1NKJ5_DESSD|nr:metal-dependent hydrolase [Desulfocapsa sulfexigens]AGF80109.1 putative membrane-bound metal-dependent hydrolase [Desulfocapsa sulfexigens DSM 10523]
MTGPTHIAIALSIGMVAGASKVHLGLIAAGAILPDLDHPQSFIGRVFFPISIPLNQWLGHRGAFHSFWLWLLVCLGGYFWTPAFFLGAGAILHILADCGTVSGVRALSPWSQKLFVVFRRSWRIKSGSPHEILVLICFGMIAWGGGYMGAVGGIRAMIGHVTGAPKIMMEEFISKGLTKCKVKGKFRWNTGEIEEGEWLIIGTEGQTGLAMRGKDKLIHIPKDGKFLKARLKPCPNKSTWELVQLKGWAETEKDVYFMDGKKWHIAQEGEVVWGQILGDKIELESLL